MPLAPNITCKKSHAVSRTTPAVASRRRPRYTALRNGCVFAIQRSANASACGACSTTARSPSSGFGTRTPENFLTRKSIAWRLGSARKFTRIRRFGIDPYHRLRAGNPVADPRSVVEHELQPIFAHQFGGLAAEELARFGL